jgi:hypothetical protein
MTSSYESNFNIDITGPKIYTNTSPLIEEKKEKQTSSRAIFISSFTPLKIVG